MDSEHTSDLLRELELLSDASDGFQTFRSKHTASGAETLKDYLNEYLTAHPDLRLPQIIFDADIDKNYAYQLFNGHRSHPDKYKLIPVCVAMHMSVKETDRALFLAGQPRLYAKKELDAAIIICLNRRYHTMMQVNEFLCENGLL